MFTLLLSTSTISKRGPSVRVYFSPRSDRSHSESPGKAWTPEHSEKGFPDQLLDFPTSGQVAMFQFELPTDAVDLKIGVSRFPAKETEPNLPLWASVSSIGQHDVMVLTALLPNVVVGNVMHAGKTGFTPAVKNCVARCADGTAAQGCVTCTFEDVTIKLCC
jgi:hypothetical protein